MKSMPAVAAIAALTTGLLAACSSAPPLQYYTLVRPVEAAGTPRAASGVEVASVKLPAAVDYPNLVLRQGNERVQLAEGQQWIAPLSDEIRNGLAARLAGVAAPAGVEDLRLFVDVTRFESVLDHYALIEAQWQLRAARGATVGCASRASVEVGPGFEALVAGHQQALDRLAADIARGVRAYVPRSTSCPV